MRPYPSRHPSQAGASLSTLSMMPPAEARCELRRIPIPRTPLNKGLSSLVCRLTPEPGCPSRNGYGPPDGYELTYSVPCANPYHHLPEEAPRLHTPVHVPLHVPPKWGVLPPFQVGVRYNQD